MHNINECETAISMATPANTTGMGNVEPLGTDGLIMQTKKKKKKRKMKSLSVYINENTQTLLWIDDIRNPKDSKWQSFIYNAFNNKYLNITWIKSYKECVAWVDKNGLPDYVCFDHDLGDVSIPDNEKTGYDCCKYIVDYCMDNNVDFPQYAIQSDNGPGRDNIDKYIKNFQKHCR